LQRRDRDEQSFGFAQGGQGGIHRVDCAHEIHVHGSSHHRGLVDCVEPRLGAYAGVADENVDVSLRDHGLVDQGAAFAFYGNVRRDGDGRFAGLADFVQLFAGAGGQGYAGAAAGCVYCQGRDNRQRTLLLPVR